MPSADTGLGLRSLCSVLPWLHSITMEDDYVSPWQATENACFHALECVLQEPEWDVNIKSMKSPGLRPALFNEKTVAKDPQWRQRRKPSFDPIIEIWMGDDECLAMYGTHMELFGLRSWNDKPWSMSVSRCPSGLDSDQEDVDQDELQLMQTGAVRRMAPVPQAHNFVDVYGLNRHSHRGRLHSDLELRAQIALIVGINADDISFIYPVLTRLHGDPLETRPHIVLLAGDLADPQAVSVVIFEIFWHQEAHAASAPRYLRHVGVLPRSTTREHVLQLLRVERFCEIQVDRCLVFHNDAAWPLQDVDARFIDPGSVLQVHLPPDPALPSPWSIADGCSWAPIGHVIASPVSGAVPHEDEAVEAQQEDGEEEQQSGEDEMSRSSAASPSTLRSIGHDHEELYFMVWYIDHSRWHHCELPRLASIPIEQNDWLYYMARAWRDRHDPYNPSRVSSVHPQPTVETASGRHRPIHVVLEQSLQLGKSVALVWNDPTISQPYMSNRHAHSVPAYLACELLLRAVGMEQHCRDLGQCECFHGDRQLETAHISVCPAGAYIQVRPQWRDVPLRDISSFMQLSMNKVDVPSKHSFGQSAAQFCIASHKIGENDAVEAWEPPRRSHDDDDLPPHRQEEEAQDRRLPDVISPGALAGIAAAWLTRVGPGVDPAGVPFLTFFLHGDHHPRCDQPRAIQLGPEIAEWPQRFYALWQDRMDPVNTIMFRMPRPHYPRNSEDEHAGHILIIQASRPEQRAHHLSIRVDVQPYGYRAVLSTITTNRYQLILQSDLAPLCFRGNTGYQCQATHGGALVGQAPTPMTDHGEAYCVHALRSSMPSTSSSTSPHAAEQSWTEDRDEFNADPTRAEASEHDQVRHAFGDIWRHWSQMFEDLESFTVKTWYIHHESHLQCADYRLVNLGPLPHLWKEHLRGIWNDKMDPTLDFSLHWVQPQPAHESELPYTAHII